MDLGTFVIYYCIMIFNVYYQGRTSTKSRNIFPKEIFFQWKELLAHWNVTELYMAIEPYLITNGLRYMKKERGNIVKENFLYILTSNTSLESEPKPWRYQFLATHFLRSVIQYLLWILLCAVRIKAKSHEPTAPIKKCPSPNFYTNGRWPKWSTAISEKNF